MAIARPSSARVHCPKGGGTYFSQGGPAHPFHQYFNPGPSIGLGYDDLKTIEAAQFLKSVATGQQGEPGFSEALAVANVQTAVIRSWESERWEQVESIKVA